MKHTSLGIKIAMVAALGLMVLGNAAIANAQDQTQTPATIQIVRALATALLDAGEKAINEPKANILLEVGLGKTFADVIQAHHGDLAAIEAAAKATVTDQIHTAVAAGKATQAQADKLLGRLDSALDQLANHQWPGNADPRLRLLRAQGLRLLIGETAAESNIKQRDVLPELRAGKTLAQIATAHQADPSKIVTAVVASETKQVNTMVTNGRLTQDQANIVLAALPDAFTRMMNQTHPLGGAKNPPATPAATPAASAAM